MRIEWTTRDGTLLSAPILEPERSFVEALGVDAAAKLLLNLGGGYVYIRRPGPPPKHARKAALYEVMTVEEGEKLFNHFGEGTRRLPLANCFLARYLRGKELSVNEIAWKLRLADTAVRPLLRPEAERLKAKLRRKEALLAMSQAPRR